MDFSKAKTFSTNTRKRLSQIRKLLSLIGHIHSCKTAWICDPTQNRGGHFRNNIKNFNKIMAILKFTVCCFMKQTWGRLTQLDDYYWLIDNLN